jgi:hypothetical protein
VDFKLCLRTNVWVAVGQALVAAITGEADRLLSLGDASQFKKGRTRSPAKINSGQGSTLAHTLTHTH